MSILHTKFLVHWTGRDLQCCEKPNLSELNDKEREKYVERLKDIVEKGFYMNMGHERIWDGQDEWIKTGICRLCFSEIKLSLARKHAERYGLLGIGVDRNFVLERYGNPVFYQYNGKFNCIAENLRLLRHDLAKRDKKRLKQLEVILAYCKNMNKKPSEDFLYYDEMEWRIVDLKRLSDEAKIRSAGRDGDGELLYRVPLEPKDIRVIVFPDDITRDIALSDDFICGKRRENWIITTLDDCEHF